MEWMTQVYDNRVLSDSKFIFRVELVHLEILNYMRSDSTTLGFI